MPGRSYPNEACGIVVGTAPPAAGGTASRWFADAQPGRLAAALHDPPRRPLSDLHRRSTTPTRRFWAIVHSHVRSPGPAVADRHRPRDELARRAVRPRLARRERGRPATGEPGIRAWRIVGGEVVRGGARPGERAGGADGRDPGARGRDGVRLGRAPRRRDRHPAGARPGRARGGVRAARSAALLLRAVVEDRRRSTRRRPGQRHARPRRAASGRSGSYSWPWRRSPLRAAGCSAARCH